MEPAFSILDAIEPAPAEPPFSILDAVEAPPRVTGGGPRRGRPAEKGASAAPLESLTTEPSECEKEGRGPCISKEALFVLGDFIESRPPVPPEAEAALAGEPGLPAEGEGAEVVRRAAAALRCRTESCVLTAQPLREFAAAAGKGELLRRELATNFKPRGPREGTALLSNFDIDATLRRWKKVFPGFHACPFAMMDFAATREPFETTDLKALLVGGEAQTFGCVVNTDRSTGPGKHWVAVFVDARPRAPAPWSVEYFNSAGNPPPPAMAAWMERRRGALEAARGAPVEAVPVTDVVHQESQTECGLYALYYIRRRLEGAPYSAFGGAPIPDAAMTEFRRHLFRAH